jgi:hypothetical protein
MFTNIFKLLSTIPFKASTLFKLNFWNFFKKYEFLNIINRLSINIYLIKKLTKYDILISQKPMVSLIYFIKYYFLIIIFIFFITLL